MSGFERGVQRGFGQILTEVIVGIAIPAILEAFINTGLVSLSYILLIRLAGTISTLIFVFFIPVFGTSYTIGWLHGLVLMSSSGLVNPYDYLFYLIPLIIGWSLRLLRKYGDQFVQ